MSIQDILPDSRARETRGRVFAHGTTWLPVFCANCGKEGGLVTESCTFAFWICNPCEKTHGHITGLMRVPDQTFYENLAAEQLAYAGRPMTHQELLAAADSGPSPLATLIREAT